MKKKVETVKQWEYRGRECEIKKMDMGHYCGYVETKIGNELENPEPGNEYRLVDVHGGVTYSPDDSGWIGFDCGHARDMCLDENGRDWGTINAIGDPEFIWRVEDVKEECEKLVDEILEAENHIEMKGKCKIHGNELVYNDRLERAICPFCINNDN